MGVYFSQTSVIFLASDLADVRIIEVSALYQGVCKARVDCTLESK